MPTDTLLSLTPGIPTYSEARAFLRVLNGTPYTLYRSMYTKIQEQMGRPDETVNWTDPESWIPERLSGEEQALALKIWRETGGLVNPRHVRGAWYFTNKHDLLCRGSIDRLEITLAGSSFLENQESGLVVQMDRYEGLLTILQIIAERSPAKRGDILPGYVEFCNTYTTYRTELVYKSSLYDRLVNLLERGLIERNGQSYEIMPKGIHYLAQNADQVHGRAVTGKQTELQIAAQTITREARQRLAEYLGSMDPYKFEQLVGLLLEEMGYANIIVTSPSNDRGVDVAADIELGISSVREVVQVKRHASSINRTVLDQLRGSLYRFKAFRGTIITTGSFSAGAKHAALEQGAAPITLIDGDKLLDLLFEYGIGVSKKAIEFYEFDDSKLMTFEENEASPEKDV